MDEDYEYRDEALEGILHDLERAARDLLAELDRPAEDRLPVVLDKAMAHLRTCADAASLFTDGD